MQVRIDDVVMLPGYQPFPRYGRVAAIEEGERVRVTGIACGDPRCAAEHQHGDMVWRMADIESAKSYQPRARWESGRRSSPNVPVS